ncbi:MAG: hypothetical protein VX007_00295 [Pseudomonadota bacterium]|nr:hypothetical protein [Pseudomonadota bacterium]
MDGIIGILVLGLMAYLIVRYPLKKMPVAYKVAFIFIFGIVGLICLFAVMGYMVN